MGRLIRLELENFKTYAGRQTIGPFIDSLTCVIGPNGVGKSNLLDAIMFVLGVGSHSMRSQNLGQLIYKPPKELESEHASRRSSRVINKASVTLYYAHDPNRSSILNRTIVLNMSTGVATSEYRIDGRVVSQSDYLDFLASENVLVKARNFLILQGQIDTTGQQSAIELRKFLEQVSGSEDLIEEYDRLKAERDQAESNISLAASQRTRLQAELRALQAQKNNRQRVEELHEQIKTLTVEHLLWSLFRGEKEGVRLDLERTQSMNEVKAADAMVKEYSEEVQRLIGDKGDIQRRLEEGEKNLRLANKSAAELAEQLATSHEKRKLLQQRQRNLTETISKNEGERKKREAEAEQLKAELVELESAKARFEQEQTQADVLLSLEQQTEFERLEAEVREQVAKEKVALTTLIRAREPEISRLRLLRERLEEREVQLKQICANEQDLLQRRQECDKERYRLELLITELQHGESTALQQKQELEVQKQQLTARLNALNTENMAANYRKHESEKQQRINETIATLTRLFPGIRGKFIDLVTPKESRYMTAFNVILAPYFEYVVVDHSGIVEQCIRYLQEHRLPRLTFIPLESIETPDMDRFPAHLRMASTLLSYDFILRPAVEFACGSVAICETFAEARQVSAQYTLKAVSMDGNVAHKGGSLTGGSTAGVERDALDFNALQQARNKHRAEELQAQIAELSRQIARLEHQSDRERLVHAGEQHRMQSAELQALARQLDQHAQRRKVLESEIEVTQYEIETLQTAIEFNYTHTICEIEQRIKQVETHIFNEFCLETGIKDICIFSRERESRRQMQKETRLQFAKTTNNIEAKLEYLGRKIEDHSERLLAECNTALLECERSIATINEQRLELQTQIREIQSHLEPLREQTRSGPLKQAKDRLAKAKRDFDSLFKSLGEIESRIEDLTSQRLTLLRKCRLEGSEIPLEKRSMRLDEFPLEVEPARRHLNRIRPDYSLLRERERFDETFERETYIGPLSELSAELDRLLTTLRPPEKVAADEHRIRETLEANEKERQKLREVQQAFNVVKNQRHQLFMKAYTEIRGHLQAIYLQLAGTERRTGATGEAVLTLENETEPYMDGVRFQAKPPGKRLMDMDQLSGGERTIAALSLLFAVHAFRPAPFFILDEIDSNLDYANVMRVSKFLLTQRTTQFIIISLKPSMYEQADSLLGIYRDKGDNMENDLQQFPSRVLSLRLKDFDEVEVSAAVQQQS